MDISLCLNKECIKRLRCLRATAKPNKFRQSYTSFKINEDGHCEWFIDNKGYGKQR